MTPTFFKTQQDFRNWLIKNHEAETELLVGFYKKDSKKESIDWPQSVDEAICFGWIDGIRKRIDGISYSIRFTPRRPDSIWSNRNIEVINRMIKENKMYPAGLKIYESRKEDATGIYSYEKNAVDFTKEYRAYFKKNKEAFNYFEAQSNTYKKATINWVITAKREETQKRRLEQLIQACEKNERLKQFTSNK